MSQETNPSKLVYAVALHFRGFELPVEEPRPTDRDPVSVLEYLVKVPGVVQVFPEQKGSTGPRETVGCSLLVSEQRVYRVEVMIEGIERVVDALRHYAAHP